MVLNIEKLRGIKQMLNGFMGCNPSYYLSIKALSACKFCNALPIVLLK